MSLRLAILGLLMEGDKHPYLIQSEMRTREMGKYIHIQKGSLYYAIGIMESRGLVRATGDPGDKEGRTVYAITAQGRKEFLTLLRSSFLADRNPDYPLYASLAFARYLPADELTLILDGLDKKLTAEIASLEETIQAIDGRVPLYGVIMAAGALDRMRAELLVLRRVAAAADAGSLFSDTPLGLVRRG